MESLFDAACRDRILARIDLLGPDTKAQWTMNGCLAAIGIRFPGHRERAVAIGENLGLYRDHPVSRGCTSPFAPIRIREMVKRNG
jgi:hypothetical protein